MGFQITLEPGSVKWIIHQDCSIESKAKQSKIHKQMNALTFIPSIDVSAKRMCLKPHMQPFLLLHGIDFYLSLFRSLPLFPFSPLLSH